VRTLTGKEIELDIEADYKVNALVPRPSPFSLPPPNDTARNNADLADRRYHESKNESKKKRVSPPSNNA
jgi:hypothetical protein